LLHILDFIFSVFKVYVYILISSVRLIEIKCKSRIDSTVENEKHLSSSYHSTSNVHGTTIYCSLK
jgi:hypothetical protein